MANGNPFEKEILEDGELQFLLVPEKVVEEKVDPLLQRENCLA
jgi:hypothetical protein